MTRTEDNLSQQFETLVLESQDRLLAFAKKLCKDPDEAQDLVQETFLRAWTNFRKFDHSNFFSWACQILLNYFYDTRRRALTAQEAGPINLSPPEDDLALRVDIEAALATLTVRERRIVEKLAWGMTRKEIAADERLSKAQTHNRITSAKRKIKDYLDAGN